MWPLRASQIFWYYSYMFNFFLHGICCRCKFFWNKYHTFYVSWSLWTKSFHMFMECPYSINQEKDFFLKPDSNVRSSNILSSKCLNSKLKEEELFSEWFGSITSSQRDDVPTWGQFCAKTSSAEFPHFCYHWFGWEREGLNSTEKEAWTTAPDWEHTPRFP